MNESILKALIQLFAIVVDMDKHNRIGSAKEVVRNYLEQEFSREIVRTYLGDFDEYIQTYHPYFGDDEEKRKGFSVSFSTRVHDICHSINNEFEQHQKVWLILQLIEFISDSQFGSDSKFGFVKGVAQEFNISEYEFGNGKEFILCESPDRIPLNQQILLIDSNTECNLPNVKHLRNEKLSGQVWVLHIESTNTLLVKYFGETNLFLNSRNIKPGRTYIFGVGSVIRSPKIDPIYYTKVSSLFIHNYRKAFVQLSAIDIEYRHKGSKDGIHPFSFEAHSGQLIGVMGGSGVGKSTLLNLLNGNLKPYKGKVCINGYDVHNESPALEGLIGYVPQDDLLVEELSVYQNLYFGASLCFSKATEEEIKKLVEQILNDFDLVEARDLKVGNPINKFISGGQRKRLNIAMELMREPAVLYIDEPTSGLSSMDSERIILLLKRQTLKGKLVIANIHQPSSDLFKLFDKIIVLDQGGRIIFQGNPMDAVVYFKTMAHYLKAEESECLTCGNVNTEQILRIVEARVVNEYGKLTRKRKRSADEWYELYLNNVEKRMKRISCGRKIALPLSSFSIPSKKRQMLLFFKRTLLGKVANRQFMGISLFEAPLLAIILGYFTKYVSGTLNNPGAYIFSDNDNIPSFLFMSVVAALFLGLTMSAEEIIRDQRVRQREKFLNLSYFSYINSKVLVLLIFSAIQTLLFVGLGHFILEIRGMLWSHWLILFSTAVCANLIGLNISAALSSVVSIYISIPLILVPLMLFSGVIVNFQKLHKNITHPEYVPLIGDLMVSRWAYEALCVHQFKANRFEREFFEFDQVMSNETYNASFVIPRLQLKLDEVYRDVALKKISNRTKNDLRLVKNQLAITCRDFPVDTLAFPDTSLLKAELVNIENIDAVKVFLDSLRSHYLREYEKNSRLRDAHYDKLVTKYGSSDAVFKLKRRYHNKALEDLVLNKNEIIKVVEGDENLIRRYDPIFARPTAINGRAHFFSAEKRIGKLTISTLVFNVLVIWLMSFAFYVTLLTSLPRKAVSYFEQFRFKRLAKRIAKYIPK